MKKVIIEVNKDIVEAIEMLLELEDVVMSGLGYSEDVVNQVFTAKFEDGYEADIKFCSGENNFFIDPVLFDENGYEACVLDGEGELLGEYWFEANGEDYVVIIESSANVMRNLAKEKATIEIRWDCENCLLGYQEFNYVSLICYLEEDLGINVRDSKGNVNFRELERVATDLGFEHKGNRWLIIKEEGLRTPRNMYEFLNWNLMWDTTDSKGYFSIDKLIEKAEKIGYKAINSRGEIEFVLEINNNYYSLGEMIVFLEESGIQTNTDLDLISISLIKKGAEKIGYELIEGESLRWRKKKLTTEEICQLLHT